MAHFRCMYASPSCGHRSHVVHVVVLDCPHVPDVDHSRPECLTLSCHCAICWCLELPDVCSMFSWPLMCNCSLHVIVSLRTQCRCHLSLSVVAESHLSVVGESQYVRSSVPSANTNPISLKSEESMMSYRSHV